MTLTTDDSDSQFQQGGDAPASAPDEGGAEAAPAEKRDAKLMDFIRGLIPGRSEQNLHETLKEYVAEGDAEGEPQSLATNERSLISNILALRGMRAVDVMIPRADIVAIDITTGQEDLLALFSERQYSRFPVYSESLDDVIGTIHIKDILSTLARGEKLIVDNLVRDVPIVSPAMHVLDLLLEMKETRRHMALVVDEFGGIDGLVTVGDIISAIVGEIEDEHEVDDQPELLQNLDGSILADARVTVEQFEARFGEFLSDEERQDIDTLGGLVFAIAGHVPARGEVITYDDSLMFEVLDADARRVHRLRIRDIRKDEAAEE